jgi:hypothetical protein
MRQQKLFLERTHSQTVAVLMEITPPPRGSYHLLEVFHPSDWTGIRSFLTSHGQAVDLVDLQNVTRRLA